MAQSWRTRYQPTTHLYLILVFLRRAAINIVVKLVADVDNRVILSHRVARLSSVAIL